MTITEDDWNSLYDHEPSDGASPRPTRTVELPTMPAADPACQAERDRVLRHPEIAARLCQPPLGYSRPEVWNGYVPPETWRERTNDSPCRRQLLEIITAAIAADEAAP